MADNEALRVAWANAGQGHVFRFWDDLTEDQRDILCKQARVRPVQSPVQGAKGSIWVVVTVATTNVRRPASNTSLSLR